MKSEIMSAAEAAESLGICVRRVYQLIHTRMLPGVKRGRRTLIPRQAFDAYIQQINRAALSNVETAENEAFSPTNGSPIGNSLCCASTLLGGQA